MKKVFGYIFLPVLSFALLLSGCLKDTYKRTYTYTYYKPVYKTKAEVLANVKSNAPQPLAKPGKMFVLGHFIFLNDIDKGVHIIDNTDPSHPRNIAFITIPGNMDIAVKDNTLYADMYSDLVAIDISDPNHAVLKKVVENIFPNRYYYGNFSPDTSRVIASWVRIDTTVVDKGNMSNWLSTQGNYFVYYTASAGSSYNQNPVPASVAPYGVGGSTARFALAANHLYTVNNSDLNIFALNQANDPVYANRVNIGWNIETIYPFLDKLFIGAQSGMYVYSISNPDGPVQAGQFGHVRSCDPVIADGQYAYVTLRSGTTCQGYTNQLDILKLNDLLHPSLVRSYQLTNPRGLSKDRNILFICDGADGLKVFDVSEPDQVKQVAQVSGMETNDVIAGQGKAIVVANDGLYEYDYSDLNHIQLLSKINSTKE